jgi:hypothetical protein
MTDPHHFPVILSYCAQLAATLARLAGAVSILDAFSLSAPILT